MYCKIRRARPRVWTRRVGTAATALDQGGARVESAGRRSAGGGSHECLRGHAEAKKPTETRRSAAVAAAAAAASTTIATNAARPPSAPGPAARRRPPSGPAGCEAAGVGPVAPRGGGGGGEVGSEAGGG